MNYSQTKPTPRELAVLAVILLIASALRFVALDAPLWYDEIATVLSHVNLPWGEMMRDYSMNHHYFFSLKAKLAAEIFGAENWAYRLPSALFGIGTVVAIWWLARDIGGSVVAHISALLVALSYHQVWFSQSARGYTELAFWSTLGLILFLRGTYRPNLATWLGFGITAAAAVFTHLTGAFFFVALGLVWLVSLVTGLGRGPLDRQWIAYPLFAVALGLALTLAVYLPILPSVFDAVSVVAAISGVDPMQEYKNPVWTVLEGLRTAVGDAGPLTAIIGVGALVVVGFGAVAAHRAHPLFFLAIIGHVVVTIAFLMAVNMRIWPRFFFVDIGLVIVLAVLGCRLGAQMVGNMIRRPNLSNALFGLGVAAMLAISTLLVVRNYSAPKQDFDGAVALVRDIRSPGDRVLALGPVGFVFEDYFETDWAVINDPESYREATAGPEPLILIVCFPRRVFRLLPDLANDVDDGFELVARFPGTLGDGNIIVYRRN